MLIICRFTQQAAPVFKMGVSYITTQQIVYLPVHVVSSVSVSELTICIMLAILREWIKIGKLSTGTRYM